MEKLDHIPVTLDFDVLTKRFHLERTGEFERFNKLFEDAKTLIDAKAVYKTSYIDEKLNDAVDIEGTRFKSKVLRKNLSEVGRVFAYVVTIGAKLDEMAEECDDLLEKHFLDSLGNSALVKARKYLQDELQSRFALDSLSYMSPGSLEDWPIEAQPSLFSLLGDVEATIGVKLNESLLMIPRKSVSGIFFSTNVSFQSCQLCPRENCQGRRAKYSEKLAKEYGVLS
jgi:hypothetical protein